MIAARTDSVDPDHRPISGNLVFEDQVIAECVPRMLADLTMILVRIIAAMRQNEVGIDPRLEALEPTFDLVALGGKKAIFELHNLDARARRGVEEVVGRLPRFLFSRADPAKHAPRHIKVVALCDPRQQRPAGANLYIVRMSSEAQNGLSVPGVAKTQ